MTESQNPALSASLPASAQRHRTPPVPGFRPFPREETELSIPERFEQQAKLYPHRLAVKTERHALTYAALDQAANRVAHALLARRGPGQEPIALLLDHDAPWIVGLLGVLKAGKLYVPLDPAYPPARTAFMLEDSQAPLLLTQDSLVSRARELAGSDLQLLNLDEIDPGHSAESPGLDIPPDAYSYLLYTSGSTGQPKGVVQNHRNVLHFTMRNTNAFSICPEDRWSLFVSCSFSGSATAIFGSLLTGSCLHPFHVQNEGLAYLADWLIQEEITILHIGGMFRHFVGGLSGKEQFPRIRLICRGGEPLTWGDVELFQRHFAKNCVLSYNLGSTELKIYRRYFIYQDTPVTGSIVPVGYAEEGTEVLILREDGQPVAEGEVGEIVVKSRYIAPAYWRRPDLTRAKFQPDPAGSDERIYRTGDLGRLLPDSCLLCLGRKDAQVKIRGHRVELAEVEAALLELPSIREAVVAAREDSSGDLRLVAYLAPGGTPAPTVSALRHTLARRLPEYMLPTTVVMLETLPRSPNGKVDRLALPEPDRARPELDTPYLAPRTAVEVLLAAVWSEILQREPVGVHDSFLELGGHSLLATRVLSRIRDLFQVELPLPAFFAGPTVAALSQALTAREPRPGWTEQVARLRGQIEAMSAADVRSALQQKRSAGANGMTAQGD
jgi:amino acid adenylation domain-containing protein